MRSILALLILAQALWAAELDATVTSVGTLNGQLTITTPGNIDAFNCKLPTQTEPKFEFSIYRPPECPSAMDVMYDWFDFATGSWQTAGKFCVLPASLACKAEVPIRLGGQGSGTITQELIRLYGECGGVRYEKSFTFTITHRPDTAETNVLSKIAQAESALQSCTGTACAQASAYIDAAKAALKICSLTHAFNNATEAINLLTGGQAVPSGEAGQVGPITIPALPPQQQPPQNATPPAQPTGQPAPTMPAQPAQTTGNVTQPRPPATPPSTPTQTAEGPKLCPLFLALLPLAAFVLRRC
ncbi:MAG: hypothetical protein QXG98_06210 [Candidatus Micrarchaeia archaeon]